MLYEKNSETTKITHFPATLDHDQIFLEISLLLSMKNKH
jgi:hypothetical protein